MPFFARLSLALLPITLIAGCGAGDDAGSNSDNITSHGADEADNLFDQAAIYDGVLKRHAGVRETDMKDGTLRWNCADVGTREIGDIKLIGVDGDARGQEYCEYHAVQDNKYVTSMSQVDTSKPLQCYFTSVYADLDGQMPRFRNGSKNPAVPGKRDKAIAADLSKAENYGSAFPADQVRMQGPFNSRGAATTLIQDCSNIAPSVNDERQAACYQASIEKPKNAVKLRAACKGLNLEVDAKWQAAQKLGAKLYTPADGAKYEHQRDLIGLLATARAEHGGVTSRNSDPMICGRVFRAATECGCNWNELPDSLEGFLFTGWTADSMPNGCRRAVVDGKPYPQITICDVAAGVVEDLALDDNLSDNLSKFCNETFAKDVVMKAPLRAVEVTGSCKTETAFCKAFEGK